MSDAACRDLTDQEIRAYQDEGAALVPQCVDPASGLEFVRGSHTWGKWFRPVLPDGGEDTN